MKSASESAERERLTIAVSGCGPRTASLLRRTARFVLTREGFDRGMLEITVVADREMREAHAQWKGDRSSTDVLTFDMGRSRGSEVDGLIMTCRDTARREARSRGTSLHLELQLYVVHGCLHLCGYDDRKRRDFLRMHRREDELLAELGCGPVFARQAPPSRRST